jgi:hypothetical protein
MAIPCDKQEEAFRKKLANLKELLSATSAKPYGIRCWLALRLAL